MQTLTNKLFHDNISIIATVLSQLVHLFHVVPATGILLFHVVALATGIYSGEGSRPDAGLTNYILTEVKLMFSVDPMSRTPVYEQIIEQFQKFILTGIMKAGDKMPSVRSLSVTLKTNPNTIQKAYSELDRRGLTYSVPGRGVFISEDAQDNIRENERAKLSELTSLVTNLSIAGISRDEVIACINKIYDSRKDGSNDQNR